MYNLRPKNNILVFFTFGVSLKIWVETGLAYRELKIYHKLIDNGYNISFFTFGDKTDLEYKELTGDISIIPLYKFFSPNANKYIRLFTSFFVICRLRSLFSSADIYLTNQMKGSWIPLFCKFIFNSIN